MCSPKNHGSVKTFLFGFRMDVDARLTCGLALPADMFKTDRVSFSTSLLSWTQVNHLNHPTIPHLSSFSVSWRHSCTSTLAPRMRDSLHMRTMDCPNCHLPSTCVPRLVDCNTGHRRRMIDLENQGGLTRSSCSELVVCTAWKEK